MLVFVGLANEGVRLANEGVSSLWTRFDTTRRTDSLSRALLFGDLRLYPVPVSHL